MQYRVKDFFGRLVYSGPDKGEAIQAQSESCANAIQWYIENHPQWSQEKKLEYSQHTLEEIPTYQ